MPRKITKAAVNITFKVFGALIAVSPFHRGIEDLAGGRWADAGPDVVFDTTGIDKSGAGLDMGKVAATGITIAVGLAVAWAGGQIARHL